MTFCHIVSLTLLLANTTPHAKQELSSEQKRLRLSEVRGFWPSNIVSLLQHRWARNETQHYKWQAERGRSRDGSLHSVVSPELNVTYAVIYISLIPLQIYLSVFFALRRFSFFPPHLCIIISHFSSKRLRTNTGTFIFGGVIFLLRGEALQSKGATHRIPVICM